MIIVMEPKTAEENIKRVVTYLENKGFKTILNHGDVMTVTGKTIKIEDRIVVDDITTHSIVFNFDSDVSYDVAGFTIDFSDNYPIDFTISNGTETITITDKDGTKGIVKGKCNAKPREVGDRLAASYINYYQGEQYVILPKFGVPEDQLAYKQFKAMYPEKDIIQIDSKEILLGGGNIHCIAMQIPYMKGLNDYED